MPKTQPFFGSSFIHFCVFSFGGWYCKDVLGLLKKKKNSLIRLLPLKTKSTQEWQNGETETTWVLADINGLLEPTRPETHPHFSFVGTHNVIRGVWGQAV